MPSEASDTSLVVKNPSAATGVGKRTYSISKTSFGKLDQHGSLVTGYPIFASSYDSSDRTRYLFDYTWQLSTDGDKQSFVYPHTGIGFAADRFLIDWYNSISDTQLHPFGMPDNQKENTSNFITFMFGNFLNIEPDRFETQTGVAYLDHLTYPKGKVVDNIYTFENTKQYAETVKINVNLANLEGPFESEFMKNSFEALFEDGTYDYYNTSLNKVASGAELKSIVNFDTWFFDYSFNYERAFTNTELNNLNSMPGALYADISTHYSADFNFEQYLETISNNKISERALPMYYAFPENAGYASDEEAPPGAFIGYPDDYQLVYENFLKESIKLKAGHVFKEDFQEIDLMNVDYPTLNNLFNGNTIGGTEGIDHELAGSTDKELYYKLYSARTEQFLGAENSPGPIHNKIAKKYSNVCITESKKDLLKNIESVRSQYPVTVGISFNPSKKKDLSNVLNQTSMMAPLMGNVANTLSTAIKSPFVEIIEQTTLQELSTDNMLQKESFLQETEKRSWDLYSILQKYFDNFTEVFSLASQENTTFISNNEIDFADPSKSLIKYIFSLTALSSVLGQADSESRTYENMMNGELSEASEVLFYRIEKSSNGTVVQNILVPNMSEQNIINVLDTQVKYDKYYEYRVYAYHAVKGLMYKYDRESLQFHYSWEDPPTPQAEESTPDEQCDDTNPIGYEETCDTVGIDGLASEGLTNVPQLIDPQGQTMEAIFAVLSQPTLRLVECPYFNVLNTSPTIVLDKPPLPPDVNIIPFSGIHNRIMFLFNSNVGDLTADPISLTFTDADQVTKIRDSQGVGMDDPINFKTDDVNVSYQIFRTSTPPASYEDYLLETPKTTNKTSFVDNINANQKYYYTFRAIDKNGHISNPTAVFEVELVTLEDGSDVSKAAILPLIKEYTFPETANTYATRDFRKYLLIKPALGQDEVDYDTSNIVSADEQKNPDLINPKLGVKQNKIFSSVSGEYNPTDGTWTEPSGSIPRYKLRVTSKSTGRKFDINFKFTNEHKQQ